MPEKSMTINLGVRGISRVRSGFQGSAQDADLFTASVDRLNASLERLFRHLQQVGQQRSGFQPVSVAGGWTGGGGGGATGGTSGPLARLLTAQNAVRQDGSDFDNQYRLLRAQQGFERADRALAPQSFMQKLNTALLTTRIGFGGGGGGGAQIMPLLGRVLPLFAEGIEGLLGPLGLAAAGLKFVGDAAKSSGEYLRSAGTARALSGGTPGDIAGLTGLGIAPGDIPGAAAALRQRLNLLNGDPYALQAAQALNLKPNLGRNFGPQNEAADFLQALDALHSLRNDPEKQTQYARQLAPLDQFLETANLSDPMYQRLRQGVAARAAGFAATEQGGFDLKGSEALAHNAWEDKHRGWGAAWNTYWTRYNTAVANGTPFDAAFVGGFFKQSLGVPKPGEPGSDDSKKATEKLTQSLDNLARVVDQGGNGLGPRGSAATRMNGPALSELIRSGAYRAGDWLP